MWIFKTIVTIADFIFLLILLFFMRGLSWGKKKDRASIVGFGLMMITYVANMFCINL